MKAREYHDLFRYLMEERCQRPEDIIFVDNISDWCRQYGIPEPDREKPLKMILKNGQGCKFLIKENIDDKVIEERLRAVKIRNQVIRSSFDKADLLDTPHKKLAFLFLNEFAYSMPGIDDDLMADNWAFEEMERLKYFRK